MRKGLLIGLWKKGAGFYSYQNYFSICKIYLTKGEHIRVLVLDMVIKGGYKN